MNVSKETKQKEAIQTAYRFIANKKITDEDQQQDLILAAIETANKTDMYVYRTVYQSLVREFTKENEKEELEVIPFHEHLLHKYNCTISVVECMCPEDDIFYHMIAEEILKRNIEKPRLFESKYNYDRAFKMLILRSEGYTFKEIGDICDLSIERVRQCVTKLSRLLRTREINQLHKEYDIYLYNSSIFD